MNAKDNSRTSFDRQAATYDFDRNGSHARTVYRPVLEKLLALNWSSLLDVGAGTGEMPDSKELSDWFKGFLVWVCFIPAAILNGGLREHVLPRTVKALSAKDSLRIGICWVFLTIAFELVSGLAGGSTMTELLAAYNPLTGNLWLLVLAATLLSPAAVWKITVKRNQ